MKREEEFKNYLISKMISKRSLKVYLPSVRNFVNIVGEKPINKITENDLIKYKLWCIKTKKYQINSLGACYGSVNNYLKMGKCKHILKIPQQEIKNVIPYTRAEILTMFDVVKCDVRLNAIIKTLYFTWVRRFELCGLNVDDIDWEQKKVRINHGKGNRFDTINIHDDALTVIKEWLEHRHPKKRNDQALFLNKWGNRITEYNVNQIVKQVSVKAKISKRSYPHLFRISGITHSAERGVNVSEIAKQSRHKNIQCLLERYIRPSEPHVRSEYERGISFTEPQQPVPQPPIQPQPKQPDIQVQSEQAKLLKMLLNNEITSEAFSLAINTINSKKENKLTGYQ